MTANAHYVPASTRAEVVMNRAVAWLTDHGVSLFGSRILRVRGRTSGQWRSVPVNPMELSGRRYLVAPRGTTQWVRNLRVAGAGELKLGRKVERFAATELPDGEKAPVLREYLRRWKFEVGMFFDGVDSNASDDEIRRIAARHPVFVIESAG